MAAADPAAALTVYVDEMLADRCDIHSHYQDAETDLDRLYEQALAASGAEYETADYAWEYRRNDPGDWLPTDPAAPARS